MSSDIAIKVDGLSKCYQIYERPQDRLKQMLIKKRHYFREFWALKNVSFQIKKGETIGIIGRNGSGKSTLLQMICGTLNSTSGSIEINGRIAALLELGSGFNPEFTGRENVYMNAVLLGLKKHEVDNRFESIEQFAEIGEYIDQPVKTYSSGMFARLAFATAIHVTPDVLVVDEALSVGDFAFQYKCIQRLKALASQGCTVLFVTHDIEQVQRLCSKAIYLKKGELVSFGDTAETCNEYLKDSRLSLQESTETFLDSTNVVTTVLSNNTAKSQYQLFALTAKPNRKGMQAEGSILLVTINNQIGNTPSIEYGKKIDICLVFDLKVKLAAAVIAVYIVDSSGQLIVGTNTNIENMNLSLCRLSTPYSLNFSLENRLKSGSYAVQIFLHDNTIARDSGYIDYIDFVAPFTSALNGLEPRWAWYTPTFSTTLAPLESNQNDANSI